MTSLDLCVAVMNHLCSVQSMENLYAATGQGADGGAFRSDLQDMGRQSVAPLLTLWLLLTSVSPSRLPFVILLHQLSFNSLSSCLVKMLLFHIFVLFATHLPQKVVIRFIERQLPGRSTTVVT